jgi:ribonuclease G
LRDLVGPEVERVRIDSRSTVERATSFAAKYIPDIVERIEYYQGERPLFDLYGVEDEIQKALQRKVQLKSGGYLIIDQTEAMTTIDVNTGAFVGHRNLEETIFKTNLEAAHAICRQLRLRNLGGIIIIDFIDMAKEANRDKVFSTLKEYLDKDKNKTTVLPFSELGLIQMTRKRTRNSVASMLCEPCFYCEGNGYLLSKQTICNNIYREALRGASDIAGEKVTIKVHPDIAEVLHGEEGQLVNSLERLLGRQIVIYPLPKFHLEQFEIEEVI